MLRRTLALLVTNVALGAALVAGITATPAAAQTLPPSAFATTLTYDDSYAAEFKDEVAAAVQIWNSAVSNVQIVKAQPGQRANIRILADNGWPRATLGPVRSYGSVTVWMGRTAVNQGYNVVRIATHELGHSLGLPDRRTGLCSDLMSGSSAPVSCANAQPSSAERAAVERNYSGWYGTKVDSKPVVITDAAGK
ncbi:snapalysin family zinc-dependent metalloprotease [Actinokineospora sp. UTMC 2448]|uniref:snapalysin family zinc-dependent metalloprotease n=1 Tax=Actinokineospora sp. UTMC 2448 TaxID=2268449 RepID=UPI00216470BC|nr:snapalysin family zinc-dependent metalloprotease [Actinokineospora sp. UTMC 2448]UVS78964.1 Extracellular small neutral protease precursor [Actinokineospora sp. UTMC 2448]